MSFVPEKSKVIDYATMVALVYSMVKKDYLMQVIIDLFITTFFLSIFNEQIN